MKMKADTLIAGTEVISVHGDPGQVIGRLVYDSRQAKPGSAFFAVQGSKLDGNRFIDDAVERGAVMIVTASPAPVQRRKVLAVRVPDVRRAMAEMAAVFYEQPARKLHVVGITGTNGKTTTAGMARHVLQSAGRRIGSLGTIRYEIGDRSIPAARTTPESVDLQRMLGQMVQEGCVGAVMEVSSHGLVQKRVWGVDFDVGVFTNLTQDHLDYHGGEEQYFQAKSMLFRFMGAKDNRFAVVNLDDAHGARMADVARENAQVITFGMNNAAADVRAVKLELGAGGSFFELHSPWGSAPARLRMLGRYNVYNALAATAVCALSGLKLDQILPVLSGVTSIPGRLEEIKTGAGFQVFVDYAHTADALKNVLGTLREIAAGRLIVVFGCGGDRDRDKRSAMGSVASELADHSIVTSDNPRREEPLRIIAQIRAGFGDRSNYEVVEDRYEAIVHALSLADRNDVVLIAGKGHENYQEFADTVIPFDDRQIVRECLNIK